MDQLKRKLAHLGFATVMASSTYLLSIGAADAQSSSDFPPAPHGENCMGDAVGGAAHFFQDFSDVFGPGGFGRSLANLGQLQEVDNLPWPSCGELPRQNP